MAATTGIEWTDSTWNPIRGCSRVSEGCRNCYAEKVAYRFSGKGQPYEGLMKIRKAEYEEATHTLTRTYKPEWNGKVQFVEKHLLDPLKWQPILQNDGTAYPGSATAKLPPYRPRRIFVNSMSDLFHENVPDEWIDKIFAVMALCPQHTFQILTKRPERMRRYCSDPDVHFRISAMALSILDGWTPGKPRTSLLHPGNWPLPNVQLGVSVEDQKTADQRIPLLLESPAAVKFISAEPLLGLIDLGVLLGSERWPHRNGPPQPDDYMKAIDWVIVGGESGPGARPMHPDWARSLRDQCVAAKVSFFFKQWGEWEPTNLKFVEIDSHFTQRGVKTPDFCFSPDNPRATEKTKDKDIREAMLAKHGHGFLRVGKKAAGSLLDGEEWKEFPVCQEK